MGANLLEDILDGLFNPIFEALENFDRLPAGIKWHRLFDRTRTYIAANGATLYPQLKKHTPEKALFRLPLGMAPEAIERITPEIQAAWNRPVEVSSQGRMVTVTFVKPDNPLLDHLVYTSPPLKGVIPLYLGDTKTGPLVLDLVRLPHLLVGGETGGGKTTLLKLILSYIIQSRQADLYVSDFGKTDLQFVRHYGGQFCSNIDSLKAIINIIYETLEDRLEVLAAAGADNIAEYNEQTKNPWQRVVLAIDELHVFRPWPGIAKEEKAQLLYALAQLQHIASLGRKAGCHLVLCTQTPNAQVIPGQVRDNIPCRVAFKCVNRWASDAILQNTAALTLAQLPGRCIIQWGEDQEAQVPDYQKAIMTRELEPFRT